MTRTYENLLIDRVGTDGRVARITLNRPEKMNALSQELLFEFWDALHDLEADDTARVIIVRGAGRTGMQQITDIHLYFWNMAKVTIAQVHGYALAGGCELAMMADLVVAAEDAQLGHPGLRGLGTSRTGVIWPLVIGMRKAKELYYTGDSISGREAERIGMINYAWPKEELEENTIALADRLANATADHLAILKLNMNRFYENMGIYSSVRSSTDMDAMAQMTSFSYAWQDRMRESMEAGTGLKGALDWREGMYRNLPPGLKR